MLIIPAIDIKNGKCVRLTQGNFENEKVYSDDPIAIAKQWEKQGAKMLHVVDLDGAKNGIITNFETIKKIIKAVSIPIQMGGGIKDEKTIKKLFSLGIKRLILGTIAFDKKELSKKLLKKYTSSIIISLDAKNGKLMKRGWQESTNKNFISVAKSFEKIGVQRFIYTDIKRDGTLTEPNYKELKLLIKNVNVPVIASGGISTIEGIKKIKEIGAEGVIIGKALYEKKINLKEAINAS